MEQVCRNNCARPTVRRVFRHLVALFFFTHILFVRITSYAIFISIPNLISFSCCLSERESEGEGRGERASAHLNLCCISAAQSTSSSSTPAVLLRDGFYCLRRCLELHLLASLLQLCLSRSALDRRQLSLVFLLPSFCCPCIVSFFNQFVLC